MGDQTNIAAGGSGALIFKVPHLHAIFFHLHHK